MGRVSFVAAALVFVSILVGSPAAVQSEPPAYDPLRVSREAGAEPLEFVVAQKERQREVPILVYLPASGGPAPVVLFSHGLGGSRHGNAYLGRHWAARGYVAVFLQHPGSDAGVWQAVAPAERREALSRAANLENFLLRAADVPAVLDALERWVGSEGHPLFGLLDLERVGMSGHSYGALTTQALAGQAVRGGRQPFLEPRIRAALPMSPSSPSRGTPQEAFAAVEIPWLLMTGTHDDSVLGHGSVESRLAVYPALPAGDKYELVLDKAEHSAFTERRLPGDVQPRNPNHHRVILALSTAFWDAWLKGDEAAKSWLEGAGARSVLEPGDRWQRK